MSDQLWGLINLFLGAALAVTVRWFSDKRVIQLEEQKRRWSIKDREHAFRLQTKLRRLEQAEELVASLTSSMHLHRDKAFLAIQDRNPQGALQQLNSYIDEMSSLENKDIHRLPALISSIDDDVLNDIWKQLYGLQDSTKMELVNLAREFEIVTTGAASGVLNSPDWEEMFIEKIKAMLKLHHTSMAAFLSRADDLRLEYNSDF